MTINAYLRQDGRKGIRNVIVVAYLVECAHHVSREIYDLILRVSEGEKTCSEELGHQEFILTYKTFEPVGPACLPSAA